MENYFNYFTEIEEHYQKRRGTALLLSTLDWALIETWKDAGIPLAAVLRGIDSTFDKHDRKPQRTKTRKINSLAYCSQEVLAATEEMKEAAIGAASPGPEKRAATLPEEQIRQYLLANAQALRAAGGSAIAETADTLTEMAQSTAAIDPEQVERRLTVLEERILASLQASAPEAELLQIRESADRDIGPYRSKMSAAQIAQLHRQYTNKRLLEKAKLPRLSLFYMS